MNSAEAISTNIDFPSSDWLLALMICNSARRFDIGIASETHRWSGPKSSKNLEQYFVIYC
jgi:hypothetical protein